jgi:hypothetical protein
VADAEQLLEALEGIDPKELEALLQDLRQGDVVDVGKIISLFSPEHPLYPREVTAAPHDEPLVTIESRLETQHCVVISQDCDLERVPQFEPYVLLAPLSQVEEKAYKQAKAGLSSRYFAYPPIAGFERVVVDMRLVMSMEKLALLSEYVRRERCLLSDPDRTRLREWLGQRFGRAGLPEEVSRLVLKPIRRAVAKLAEDANFIRVFSSTLYYGLRYTPGRGHCSLLLVTDPGRRAASGVNEDLMHATKKRLENLLAGNMRDSGYSVIVNVVDAQSLNAAELLEHEPLALDIDVDSD